MGVLHADMTYVAQGLQKGTELRYSIASIGINIWFCFQAFAFPLCLVLSSSFLVAKLYIGKNHASHLLTGNLFSIIMQLPNTNHENAKHSVKCYDEKPSI